MNIKIFTKGQKDRIIEMAKEDCTPFEAIKFQFDLAEKEVISFMRRNSKPSSFRMWRERMAGKLNTAPYTAKK
jgi:uncharacterized protein (TIGR03643 family)